MLNERAKLLVDALRSGEYTQGRNRLVTVSDDSLSYCCLGVACDIYHKQTGKGKWVDHVGYAKAFDSDSGYSDTSLVAEVKDWFGFFGRAGLSDVIGERSLMGMNDDSRMTFNEIADVIEAKPASYFREITNV